jgi:hypothetical protein
MSANLPVVTPGKIRRWVGATYAERGYDYIPRRAGARDKLARRPRAGQALMTS